MENSNLFFEKYLNYKQKYLVLLNQISGGPFKWQQKTYGKSDDWTDYDEKNSKIIEANYTKGILNFEIKFFVLNVFEKKVEK